MPKKWLTGGLPQHLCGLSMRIDRRSRPSNIKQLLTYTIMNSETGALANFGILRSGSYRVAINI
jgi:hypothetical protein